MIAKTIIVSIDLFVLRWYNSIRRENFPAKYDKKMEMAKNAHLTFCQKYFILSAL